MSTSVVAFNPTNLPAFAQNREGPSAVATAMVGKDGGFGSRISIRSGVFRLISGGKEIAAIDERYLDVVIVRAAEHVARTYYPGEYQEEVATPPACWSADGVTPDKTATAPQHHSCVGCPQNIKGSGKDDSRACRFSQRIAVRLADDLEGDTLQLQVPAASLFGKEDDGMHPLQSYARWLVAQKIDPEMVVTRMRFDKKASSPKLGFKPMRFLTEDEFAIVEEASQSDEAQRAVAMTVAQVDRVVAPANLEGTPPARKAAPAPVEPEVEDEPPAPPPAKRGRPRKNEAAQQQAAVEDEAEPVVRRAPEPPPVPARTSLAATVAGWDTDD